MESINNYLEKLNEEQIKPVKQTEGAVLVLAGAGSGKTRVLTSRISYLVQGLNVAPSQILAITFTNKAANEMKERLSTMVDGSEAMWVCTIHSMCVRILRQDADVLGYSRDFTIYSETDKERVIKRILADKELETDKYYKLAKFYISDSKNKGITPENFLMFNKKIKDANEYEDIYKTYERELNKSNALDFDDLLIKTDDLLTRFDNIRDKYARKFKYIHIDEFQDTNRVQYNIVKMLSSHYGNIFAVGDDDQSIYSWRGADIDNILNFSNDFVGAKVFKLEQNYRSTKSILNLANKVIKNNQRRSNKVLWTDNEDGQKVETFIARNENEEAMFTAVAIKKLIGKGYKYSDFAVLMRLNALSRAYEQEFTKYGIPCKVYGGFKFFERKEIKDLTAYLRILTNPLDKDAVLRVINVPKRGIGNASLTKLVEYADQNEIALYDAIMDIDNVDISGSAKNKIKDFRSIIRKLYIDKETMEIDDLVNSVIERTDFMSMFTENTEENESKKMNVSELINSVKEFKKLNPKSGLSEYLNSVTLSSDTDDIEEDDSVILATVHAVKGLEFKCVYVCGMDEGIFPVSRAMDSPNDMEEERRLMYVAITRARERLTITRARERFLYGQTKGQTESCFMKEMGGLIERDDIDDRASKNSYSSYERDNYSYGTGYKDKYSKYESRSNSYGDEDFGTSNSYGGMKKTNFAQSYFSAKVQTATPKPTEQNKDYSKFRAGSKVEHRKFGEGVIISTKMVNNALIADVAFKGVGVKSLAVQFAPMTLKD